MSDTMELPLTPGQYDALWEFFRARKAEYHARCDNNYMLPGVALVCQPHFDTVEADRCLRVRFCDGELTLDLEKVFARHKKGEKRL